MLKERFQSMVDMVDGILSLLFPKSAFPRSMFKDVYWVGVFSGSVLGFLFGAIAMSPANDVGLEYGLVLFLPIVILRFITWRVDE